MLKQQMLHPLLINFDNNLVLLLQILQLPVLVPELGLLVLKALLLDYPEVRNLLLLLLELVESSVLLPKGRGGWGEEW